MKKIGIFIIIFISFLNKNVYAETLNEYQRALIATADSFLNRKDAIQYGNERLTYLDKQNVLRSELYFKPEEATYNNNYYTTCSQFAYMLYYNTFVDENNKPYQIKKGIINPEKLGTIARYLYNLTLDANSQDIIVDHILDASDDDIERVLGKLEIGDIVIYRWNNDNSSHVFIYYGDDKALESFGGMYNFKEKKDTIETDNSVRIVSLNNLNDSDGMYYRMKQLNNNNVLNIAVLRPINEIISKNYKVSQDTLTREKYSNLVVEGLPILKRFDSVNINEELKYEIKIKNIGDITYNDVNIFAYISPLTSYISSNIDPNISENMLNWKIDIPANKEVKISYVVKVKNDIKNYNKYINSYFILDSMKVNMSDVLIAANLKSEERNNVKDIISFLSIKNYSNTQNFINEIYSKLNKEVVLDDINTITSSIFNIESNVNIKNLVSLAVTNSIYGNQDHVQGYQTIYNLNKSSNSKYSKMLIDGLYGGIYSVYNNDFNDNIKRLRYIKLSDFVPGDILVINNNDIGNTLDQDGEIRKMFIYSDNNTFYTIENEKVTKYNEELSAKLIDSLLGQDNFYILKPSMIFQNITPISNNIINKNNDSNNYYSKEDTKIDNPKTGNNIKTDILLLIGIISFSLLKYLSKNKKIY